MQISHLVHRKVSAIDIDVVFSLPMKQETKTFRMLAKTLYGLEDYLAEELALLGATEIIKHNRAVEFSGDKALLYRANLTCRLATRILRPIYRFTAGSADSLYRHIRRIDWGQYLTSETSFAIDAVVSHSAFTNSLFVAQRAKDAIVDHMRKGDGERPAVDTKNPDVRLNLHIHEHNATLSLDSSGEALGRRGYRLESGDAPIGEVLAAGILRIIGWGGSQSLVDPMCGSGTFLIEAALKAGLNATDGASRSYGFMRWRDYDAELFAGIAGKQELARGQNRDGADISLIGYDIDKRQLEFARSNATRAGVAQVTAFEKRDFFNDDYAVRDSIVIFNPPYDRRMGLGDVQKFYKRIGDTLKTKFTDSTVYIITANLEAIKSVGLKATRKVKLYNGPLECRLLEYKMFSGSRRVHLQTKQKGENI